VSCASVTKKGYTREGKKSSKNREKERRERGARRQDVEERPRFAQSAPKYRKHLIFSRNMRKKVLTTSRNDGIMVKLAKERRTLKMIQSDSKRKAQSII
jgi:hypothetical protein